MIKLAWITSGLFNVYLGILAYEANVPRDRAYVSPYSTLIRLGLVGLAIALLVNRHFLRRIPLTIGRFGSLLVFLFLYGLSMGLIRGHLGDGLIEAASSVITAEQRVWFLLHAAGGLFMMLFYLVGRQLDAASKWVDMWLHAISWLTVLIFAHDVIRIFEIFQVGTSGNLSSGPLLLPAAYGFARRKWTLLGASAVLIAVCAKRGTVLALLVMTVLFFVLAVRQVAWRKLRAPIALAGLFALGVLAAIGPKAVLEIAPVFTVTIDRFERLLDIRTSGLSAASSGRDLEVEGVFETLRDQPLGLLLGAGYGATFDMEYYSPNLRQTVYSFGNGYPDVIFNYFVLYFGYPIAIGTLCGFFWLLRRGYVLTRAGWTSSPLFLAIFLFGAAYTVEMTLSFVPNNPLYFIALGVIGGRAGSPGLAMAQRAVAPAWRHRLRYAAPFPAPVVTDV